MHILSFYIYKKTPPRSAFPFLSFCFFNSDLAILIHPFFKIPIFRIFINHIINQFNQVIISFLQCNSRKFLCIRKSHISQYKIRIKNQGTASGTLVSPTDFAPSTFWAAASWVVDFSAPITAPFKSAAVLYFAASSFLISSFCSVGR